jgi:hypothetical protein
VDALAAGGTELRRNLPDQVAQEGESVASEGARSKETDGAANTPAANGQLASNVRFYKQLEQSAAARQNLSVVLSNAEAAFGEPVEVIQTDVPVYFVSVNVTPDAIRNNFVLNSLGRNSISLVNESAGNLPGLSQPMAEAEVALVEEQLAESRERRPVAEPAAPGQMPASASGVIAVEAPHEQVAAFLNDIASDRQNVTALAVLAEQSATTAETAPSSTALSAATNYSRNAEDALEQVAGNWRFEPTGEAGKPVRLERVWSAPAVAAQFAQGNSSALGANGGAVQQRYAQGPPAGAGFAGAGGYGGGFGGGAVAEPAAGFGRQGGANVQEPAQSELPEENAAPTDEKAPDAAADVQAAARPDPDAFRAEGRGVTNTLDSQAAQQEPAAAVTYGIEGLASGDDNTRADDADKKLLGRAWIVSPLQVRSTTVADQLQEQAQQHFDFSPFASGFEAGGTPPAPAEGQAAGSTDLQMRDRFGTQELEDLRLQSQDADLRDTEAKDKSAIAETVEQLGDRSDAGRSLALGAATEPPPSSAPAGTSTAGAPTTPQPQPIQREETSRTEFFSATRTAPALPQKPVRVVLFFNVLPAELEPAAAAPATNAPQPATATDSPSD